jgi:hypothetical protein
VLVTIAFGARLFLAARPWRAACGQDVYRLVDIVELGGLDQRVHDGGALAVAIGAGHFL